MGNIFKLTKPLYHGTCAAAAVFIVGGYGFSAPIYLAESREAAELYAKAATAYLEKEAQENEGKPIKEGYAIFTFRSVPKQELLVVDDWNLIGEPGQWKYLKPIRGLTHYQVEYLPLIVTSEEHLRLRCFAIGMWSKPGEGKRKGNEYRA